MLSSGIYVGVLACMGVVLASRVIMLRRKYRVSLGSGGNEGLMRAMRAFGNFAEYCPIALLLLFMTEVSGAYTWFIHTSGLVLVFGRAAHAYAISQTEFRLRKAGMIATFSVIIVLSLVLVYQGIIS